MASGLASFNARRNVRAPAITVSTIQGSSITTASITTGILSLSTLTGSTMTSNRLTLSTLTVSSINNGTPGVAAYSTFNASSINTSSITISSITTAPGYNSNISNVIYTSLADSGQTAASFTAASLPATAPAGSVISGSYRLTAGASSGAAVMRLSSYTFVVGTTYNFTFTGMQGSQALALYVYQYNSAGTASTQISSNVYSITTSAATVSGSFTPNASGTYTGTIVFYFQAAAVNQYVNFTAFSMTVGSMNVGIGMSNPIAKLQINQDGNSTANEVGTHSLGILSNQGTSGTNLMYMMLDADYTNQCCSIQSIVYGLKTWNLNLNPRGGNVGIGTTNPGAILHVSDSLTTATSIPLMLFSPNLSAGGFQYLYFGTANSANNSAQIGWANVGAGSASNYAFLQIFGKANIMTWQASTGNVGIGLTNPSANLHIHNSSSTFTGSPTVHIGDGQTDAGGTYGMLQLVRANNAADNKAHLSFIKNGLTVFGMGYYPGSNINAFGLVPSFTSMATSNGLWILTNGNVGIGITDPAGLFHVNGNAVVANYKPYVFSHFTVSRSTAACSMAIVAGTETTTATLYLGTPLAPTGSGSSAYKVCILANGNGSGSGWSTADLHFCLNNSTGGTSNDFANTASITDSKMVIKTYGNVGIGTIGPNARLHVNGTTIINGKTSIGFNTLSDGMLNITNTQGSLGGTTHFNWTDGLNYIRGHTVFDSGNWISIGTSTTFCPLYITSKRSHYWYLGAYLHSGGAHMHSANGTWDVAIWTEGVIITTSWHGTVSDQRIKKNIQPVGSMLETINKIEIVSFDFIDSANNKRDECGVIAQQIETVFPNAVDISTGVIPCYLKLATSQHLVDSDVHILFDYDPTDLQQQFKVGDKIKVHAGQKTETIDKDKGSHHVVVKSIIDGGFITEKWKDYDANDGVFIYGKEVDDFRNVDKEQLGILALKGVQELSLMVSTLQTANAATSSQMAALNGTCAALQAVNTTLESQVATLSASYASLLSRLEALEAR
jgi:hypothetical protein